MNTPAKQKEGNLGGAVLTTAFGNFVPPLAGFLTAPILAHELGVVGRGEVSAALAPLLLCVALATFGMPEALTYLVARNSHSLSRLLARTTSLIAVTGLVSTVAAISLANVLAGGSQGVAALILVASVAIIPNLLLAALRSCALGFHAWGLVAAERSVSSLVRLAAIVTLAMDDRLTSLSAVYINAWYPIIGAVMYVPLIRRERHGDPLQPDVRFGWLMRYGARVWIGSAAGVLLTRLDQVLMTPLAGVEQLGYYAVAATVAEIPLLINNTIREVMFATDARSQDDSRLTFAARASGFTCLLACALIGGTIWSWFPVLFGEHFRPSIPVTLILLAAVAVGPPGSVAGAGLAARGRPGLRSVSLLIALVVNVTLLIILAPTFGAMGAAAATLAANLISSNLNIYFLRRTYGVPIREFYKPRRQDIKDVSAIVKKMTIGRLEKKEKGEHV